LTPASLSARDDVFPSMNQRISATTASRKTHFVVRSGRKGSPFLLSENFSCRGAKME